MIQENNYSELNRKATLRIKALCQNIPDDDLLKPVGDHWTISIALAHIAFWDRRVMQVIELAKRSHKLLAPIFDDQINEILLPFLAAIPPREAVRITINTAEVLDHELEQCPSALVEEMYALNKRLVIRAIHRNEHLDEIEFVLKK